MDEARRVLRRLERIDELERRLLAELRSLGSEAERWARREVDPRADRAADRLAARFREP